MISEYLEQLKLNNLDEIDQFLTIHKLPKHNHDKTDNLEILRAPA
jgi:hypothetical protein